MSQDSLIYYYKSMFEIGQTVRYKTSEHEIPREAKVESLNFSDQGDVTSYKIRILS